MKIKILGAHSTESNLHRMSSILIDDVIAMDAGGLTSALSHTAQNKIQVVFITHQHFDHTRDLITLGANRAPGSTAITVFALGDTLEVVKSHLLNERMYLDFTRWPSLENPIYKLVPVIPYERFKFQNFEIFPVPLKHSVPSVGYGIKIGNSKSLLYTGDSGPDFIEIWLKTSPELIITEVSFPDRFEELCKRAQHICPKFLREGLVQFYNSKKYWPRVIAGHISFLYEDEIRSEISNLATELGVSIDLAAEGMEIDL